MLQEFTGAGITRTACWISADLQGFARIRWDLLGSTLKMQFHPKICVYSHWAPFMLYFEKKNPSILVPFWFIFAQFGLHFGALSTPRMEFSRSKNALIFLTIF